ncbi:hypothetical protein FRC10_001583 [Ceratobasidium sp. 414]|nr:hypothetical protein FRC10_001583 [Ceratobasidium sp. 414]
MPKGGLLHGHMDAMCDAAFLYKAALEYPNMHIRISSAITSASTPFPLPQFKALSPELTAQHKNATLLTSTSYEPNSWVPLSTARRDFQFGGPEAFDKWIIGSMMINPREAYVDYNTSVKGIIRYEPILKRYMRQVLLSSIEDGISYVELRVNFYHKTGIREDGTENLVHREWLILFNEAIEEVKANMWAQDREDEFIGAKIIYTTLRFIDNEQLEWYLEECMDLKAEFPRLIAGERVSDLVAFSRTNQPRNVTGFDLVAQEDTGRPLIYYIESLLRFQAETKKRGLDIPFIFHAGETLDDGGAADSNLYDALLLGTKRIGHGFSLAKHPLLMKMCKERGVAIEVCPISNEILRLTSSMPMHPLPVLLNNGLSVALCPDDPSVFGNMGLSFDFYQASASKLQVVA